LARGEAVSKVIDLEPFSWLQATLESEAGPGDQPLETATAVALTAPALTVGRPGYAKRDEHQAQVRFRADEPVYYRVTAVNERGESPPSQAATPPDEKWEAGHMMPLRWSTVPEAERYRVYRGPSPDETYLIYEFTPNFVDGGGTYLFDWRMPANGERPAPTTGTATPLQTPADVKVKALRAGFWKVGGTPMAEGKYRYRVSAYDRTGETTAGEVVDVELDAGEAAYLSWEPEPGAKGYRIYRAADGASWQNSLFADIPAGETVFIDDGTQQPGTAVRLYARGGDSWRDCTEMDWRPMTADRRLERKRFAQFRLVLSDAGKTADVAAQSLKLTFEADHGPRTHLTSDYKAQPYPEDAPYTVIDPKYQCELHGWTPQPGGPEAPVNTGREGTISYTVKEPGRKHIYIDYADDGDGCELYELRRLTPGSPAQVAGSEQPRESQLLNRWVANYRDYNRYLVRTKEPVDLQKGDVIRIKATGAGVVFYRLFRIILADPGVAVP
jgi:hypothetical protein